VVEVQVTNKLFRAKTWPGQQAGRPPENYAFKSHGSPQAAWDKLHAEAGPNVAEAESNEAWASKNCLGCFGLRTGFFLAYSELDLAAVISLADMVKMQPIKIKQTRPSTRACLSK